MAAARGADTSRAAVAEGRRRHGASLSITPQISMATVAGRMETLTQSLIAFMDETTSGDIDGKTMHQFLISKAFDWTSELELIRSQVLTVCKDSVKEEPMDQNARENIHRNILETLEAECQCSICDDIFVNAVITRCGHTFCSVCLHTWMNNSRSSCPMCREIIPPSSLQKNTVLENMISKLFQELPEDKRRERDEIIAAKNAIAPVPTPNAPNTNNDPFVSAASTPEPHRRTDTTSLGRVNTYVRTMEERARIMEERARIVRAHFQRVGAHAEAAAAGHNRFPF